MPKKSDVAIVVGRFQVHRLHAAHHALIKSVYDTHAATVIVLGLSQARVSTRNPLDFEARKQLLLEAFPKATIFYVKDRRNDADWSAHLDTLVDTYLSPAQTACLYGGRDSFAAHYTGKHRVDVLEPDAPLTYVSGTELRREIARSVRPTEDFRAGVIWASANGHPRVFPTVDIAVWRPAGALPPPEDGPRDLEWLLVRKPHERGWRFPGGFVQPSDASYEDAARRELAEETGVEAGPMRYVGSHRVNDWRYEREDDKIATALYASSYISGPVRAGDDVSEAGWFPLDPADDATVPLVPEHAHLRTLLRLAVAAGVLR